MARASHASRCPCCGYVFAGRPADYLREPLLARRPKRCSLIIIFPVLAGVFLYLRYGAAWLGLPTAFTGMANTLMLVMVSPSVILAAISMRLPRQERYDCRSCGWSGGLAATRAADEPVSAQPSPGEPARPG